MKKYLLIFFICMLALTAIFFLVPINLFDGEIVFEVNGVSFTRQSKLSLSFFIGIGTGKNAMQDVKDFYLLPMGYFFAFLMLIVFPALVSYRIYLQDIKKGK